MLKLKKKKPSSGRRGAKPPVKPNQRSSNERKERRSTKSTVKPKPTPTGGRGKSRKQPSDFNNRSEVSLDSARKAADNLLTVLGGRERVIELLTDSAHPKAQRLIDRLSSTEHIGEHFALSYSSVGLKSPDIVEIFGDVQQARTFMAAINESNEVMMSLIRAAKDQIEPHEKCNGGGRVLDRKTDQPTATKCKSCRGSGWVLKSGARDAQQLYFEILNWKKTGGLVNIDARKQQANFYGPSQGMIGGAQPGQAPEALAIVKRADLVLTLPAPNQQVKTEAQMPEDVITVDAEVV